MRSNEPPDDSVVRLTTTDYRAIVEQYDDEPDQCTIFPVETEDMDRSSSWVTAKAPGFVDLAEWL
jgi:hypothetical protein